MPKDWKARCARVRERDAHRCRRCGVERWGPAAAVDHCLPRRLGGSHGPSNLVLLCSLCHSHKTRYVEPSMYAANLQPFYRFLQAIGQPQPSSRALAAAYRRLRALQA